MTRPEGGPAHLRALHPDTGAGTAVIAALPAEARSARPLVRRGWRLFRAGIGSERARAAAEQAIASGAYRLLVWGTAGGLAPELTSGTVLVPETVIDPAGERHVPDPDWRSTLLNDLPRGLPLSEAPLATADAAVGSAAAKARLREATGAGAVDMETAVVAATAEAEGIPWAVIRVVADPAQSALPRAVIAALDSRHFVFKLVSGLVPHPGEFFDVLSLARGFRLACSNLNEVALALAG